MNELWAALTAPGSIAAIFAFMAMALTAGLARWKPTVGETQSAEAGMRAALTEEVKLLRADLNIMTMKFLESKEEVLQNEKAHNTAIHELDRQLMICQQEIADYKRQVTDLQKQVATLTRRKKHIDEMSWPHG